MAEQIVLLRHGFSTGNYLNSSDSGYVQGPRSGLHERGRRQIAWSAMQLGRLVVAEKVLPPTAIYTADMKRLVESAEVVQGSLREHAGIDVPIRIFRELEEKREPHELEDKTGAEIAADPRLHAIADAIRQRHLDHEFVGENGVEAHGFETWPQAFARVSLFLRSVVDMEEAPVLVSSNGPMSIARAQLEHNLDLMLAADERTVPGVLTPHQLFDDYLFKFGNAEGRAYRRDKAGGWQLAESWKRPESM